MTNAVGEHAIDICILTLFPEMFPSVLGASLLGKALEKGLWRLHLICLRDYGLGPHLTVDDAPYGGGAGMLMRPDVIDQALQACEKKFSKPMRRVYLSPKGKMLKQSLLSDAALKRESFIFLCGRYEGVDQRVLDEWQFEEISIGDFILCGGEVPAMTFIEGYLRLIPGIVGKQESILQDTFCDGLLEYPQYTRPEVWKNRSVPKVLLSGHHENIAKWRQEQSAMLTQERRPDLFISKDKQ